MGRKGENSKIYELHPTWYDIDEKFEKVIKEKPKRRFSVSELADAINDDCSYIDEECDTYNYLKKNGSDIISRLKAKTGLDLELYKTDTDKVKFEKLQLLKQICIAEKFGEKNTLGNREQKVHISEADKFPKYRMPLIDIIAKPSLGYIGGESDYAKYKPEFDRLVDIIREYTPNAKAIENTINNIHDNWKRLITSTYYDATVAFLDSQTSNGYVTKEDSIRKTFEYVRRIPVNFQNLIEIPNKQETSLIERFYILLLTTRIRAELRDYHQVRKDDIYDDEENVEVPNPNQEYLDRYFRNSVPSENFRQHLVTHPFYNKEVGFYEFEDFIRRGIRDLKDFENNEEKMDVWRLILLNKHPRVQDVKEIPDSAYNFAYNYTEKMVKMWRSSETGESEKDQYPIDTWCTVFRELMHIFLKGEYIDVQQDYYKNKSQALTAAVKSNADCRAFQNMILTKHFRDRHTLMYSSPEVVKYRQEMEKHILDIEESVMSFQTLEEIIEADRIMAFVVAINSESEDSIAITRSYLQNKINGYALCFSNEQIEHIFFCVLNRDSAYKVKQNAELFSMCEKATQDLMNYLTNPCNDNWKKLSDLASEHRQMSKPIMAEDEVVKVFNSHTCKQDSVEEQIFDYRVNVQFQEKDDYKMNYTFKVDHSARIITVTSCTFDDDIQKILDI